MYLNDHTISTDESRLTICANLFESRCSRRKNIHKWSNQFFFKNGTSAMAIRRNKILWCNYVHFRHISWAWAYLIYHLALIYVISSTNNHIKILHRIQHICVQSKYFFLFSTISIKWPTYRDKMKINIWEPLDLFYAAYKLSIGRFVQFIWLISVDWWTYTKDCTVKILVFLLRTYTYGINIGQCHGIVIFVFIFIVIASYKLLSSSTK